MTTTNPTAAARERARETVGYLYNIVCGECWEPFCEHWRQQAAEVIASELSAKDEEIEKLKADKEALLTSDQINKEESQHWASQYVAARSTLAQKVIEIAGDPYGDAVQCLGSDEPREVSTKIVSALRDLFRKEGVEVG